MSSAETFAEKAPLFEDLGLAKIVLFDLLAPEILPRVDGKSREVSTRFGATEHGLLCRCATQGALNVYGRAEPFDLSLPAVSEPLRETIERAERAVFHATELDTELLRFRATDLTLGTAAAFEAFLGDDPRLQVWPLDGDGELRS